MARLYHTFGDYRGQARCVARVARTRTNQILEKQVSTETGDPMSALGQTRTFGDVKLMSALPPKADIKHSGSHVRLVPQADISPRRRS